MLELADVLEDLHSEECEIEGCRNNDIEDSGGAS